MEQSVRAKVLTEQAQINSSTEELIDAPADNTINRYSIKNKAHYRQEPSDSTDKETVITGTTKTRKAVSFLYGLLQTKSTGKVDRAKVFRAGRYWTDIDHKFIKFEADVLVFDEVLSVFSQSSQDTGGSSLFITISVAYRLRPGSIGDLHRDVGENYKSLIDTNIIDAAKNTAILFSVEDYIINRPRVEAAMTANISRAINEVYASLDSMMLGNVVPTDDYLETRLEAAVQEEKNLEERFLQEAALIRKNTDVAATTIGAQAEQVTTLAESEATVIRGLADEEAREVRLRATSDGLSSVYTAVNMSTMDQKNRRIFDYLLALETGTIAADTTYIDFEPSFDRQVRA